jgi:RHS repeat-associated protein
MNSPKTYIICILLLMLSAIAQAKTSQTDTLAKDFSENLLPKYQRPIIKLIDDTVTNKKVKTNTPSFFSAGAKKISASSTDAILANSNYKKYDVGAIGETSVINPNGSSSVNITIDLPENPYSFQPKLNLSYNSMNMIGDLGWGWNLSGTSCITKTNKNLYFDGVVESANMANDTTAAFALDGVRLIKLSASSKAINFETAKGRILVTAALSNNRISYFEVKYPNGNIGYFRVNSNSTYYLSEVLDPRGQYIHYFYKNTLQGLLLTDIYYAKDRYHIRFNYNKTENISDIIFKHGTKFSYSYLLASIEISINSNLWKKYSINYTSNKGENFVSSIECHNEKGQALPPLEFKYGNGTNIRNFKMLDGQLTTYFPYENPINIIAQKGKFRYGIANEGIVLYPNYLSNIEFYRHKTAFRHSENYFANQYSETQEIVVAEGLEDNISFTCGKLTTGTGFHGIICANIDKTPEDEILKFNEYLEGGNDQTEITAYIPSTYGGVISKYHFKYSFNKQFKDAKNHCSIFPKNFYVGDFNGDGINEILAITPSNLLNSGNPTYLYLIDITTNRVLFQKEAPFAYNVQFCKYNTSNGKELISANDAARNSDKLFILDIDGDGKSEIVHISEDGTSTYAFESDITTFTKCRKIYFDSSLKKVHTCNHNIYIAQLNSDNLPDFVITPEEDALKWDTYLSMGNGKFAKQTITYPYPYSSNKNYFFQDINFDGKSDLVEYKNGLKYIRAYLTGNACYSGECLNSTIEENSIVTPSNISGRTWTSSLMTINNKGALKKYQFQGNDFNDKLLVGYTNSFGVAKLFTYQNLYQSEYIAGNNAQFPYINYKGALLMVSNYKEKSVKKTLTDTHYQYNNAVIHKQGLGFKGYEYIYTYDNIIGESTRTKYDVFHNGDILETDNTTQNITYEYNTNIKANKIDRSVLNKIITVNKADNVTKTEELQYDSYLNIVNKKISYNSEYATTDQYEYTNIHENGKYILGQPLKEKHTIVRGNNKEETIDSYIYSNNLVKEKKSYINNNLASTEEYEYNSDGQKAKINIKSFNSSIPHTTTYFYNEDGLICKKIGPDGLSQSFKYDNLDRMKSSEDYKGTTTLEYDGWNTLLSTTRNDGTKITHQTSWSEGEAGSIYKVEKHETGKPSSIKFYNDLGQVIREGSCHFDGNYLFVDKEYNEKGQVVSISHPFKFNKRSNSICYEYDIYGRPTTIKDYNGNVTSYSYNGLEVSCTKNGQTTTNSYNVFNDLLSVNSNKGDISYQYDGGGHIIAEKSGDVTLTYKYDSFGRLISKEDPHAGCKRKSYNAEGYVAEESDGEKNISYTYDELGRIATKNIEDKLCFCYTYNSFGELTSVTSKDGKLSKVLDYDTQHRLSSIKETNNNKQLTQTFTYKDGRISSCNYQSNNGLNATENYIYNKGILTEVNLNGDKIIWQLISEDDQGKATQYSSLGYDTKYSFDDNDNLSSIGVYKDKQLLWKEGYVFAPTTGNLLSRNNHHNLNEIFDYDDMDRLISINGHKITYDEIGNIKNNEQVGTYSYNNSRPYELKDITTDQDLFPLTSQKITYNSTLQPTSIEDNNNTVIFTYDEDGQRNLMEISDSMGISRKKKYYFGNKYELIETSDGIIERLYLLGNAYDAPVVMVRNTDGEQLYNITRDYQSSIKAIYDENNNLIQELSFDPWGRQLNPETGEYYAIGEEPELFLDRGYTGHEHLTEYQLINMNGRLYNPILGRFLSPDPILADPTNPQNYNCYAYALNNPLKYVDKNGKFPILAFFGGIIGAYIGGSLANHNFNPGKWNWSSANTYIGMVIGGGLGAAAGYGIGAGYISFNFAFATPFVAAGINFSTNDHGERVLDGGYTTIAGGSYNYGAYKAGSNAGKAYDNAVTNMKEIYNNILTDFSNAPFSDYASSLLGVASDWTDRHIDNTLDKETYNMKMAWFSDHTPVPGGTATINSLNTAGSILAHASAIDAAYSFTDALFFTANTFLDKSINSRDKWVQIGSKTFGALGGFWISLALGALTVETGPGVIIGIAAGATAGTELCSYIGGIASGFIYDAYEAYRFATYINNINNNTLIYRSFSNY